LEATDAIEAFTALAQPTRLAVVKLLVRAGPEGMASGEIARVLEAPASTMSTHLAILSRAGLVSSRRDSRVICYGADMTGLSGLLGYLIDDCCKGHPDICAPLAKVMERAACSAAAKAPTLSAQKKQRRA
jgi:DNA-binding transcriptional ArsR family regulator